jgi:hypothetical protein
MTNDVPVSTIQEQPLTTPPFIGDNTLVDDPVALVDDPTALVGGPVTIVEGIQSRVEVNRVWTNVPRGS